MTAISFAVVIALSFQSWLGPPDALWYLSTDLSPRKKVGASLAQARSDSATFIHLAGCAPVGLHVCLCLCALVLIYVCIHVCACWHVSMYLHVYMCMHTCMHIFVCCVYGYGLQAHHQYPDPPVLFLPLPFHN